MSVEIKLVNNSTLNIDYKNENEIEANSLHFMFFESEYGAQINREKKYLSIICNSNIESALKNITDYCKDYGIGIILDEKLKKINNLSKREISVFNEISSKIRVIKNILKDRKRKISSKFVSFSRFIQKQVVRKLKKFQYVSVYHAIEAVNSANFSVPGSGKTTTVYAYYSYLKKINAVNKVLVIGPLSCFIPWIEEYNACFGKSAKFIRISGIPQKQRQNIYLKSKNYELFLCSYHTAANDLEKIKYLLGRQNFLVVLDESHYIKRFSEGYLSQALLEIAPYAKNRIILTGTPMPNGLKDLWTQFTFLWPEGKLLGNRSDYLRQIDIRNVNTALDNVRDRISPFFIRIRKRDLNLPRPKFHRIHINMEPVQNKIYEALATKYLSEVIKTREEREYVRPLRKAKFIRLLQVSSNPTLLRHYSEEFNIEPLNDKKISYLIERYANVELPSKYIKLHELVSDILKNKNRKVIIWTNFIHNIFMLEKYLNKIDPEIKSLIIYGGLPKTEEDDSDISRELNIKLFKTDPSKRILIANPPACGESISLHSVCHDAIYFDRTFNCGQYLQSLDRIHRLGLKKMEFPNYYILINQNSIDEVIDERLNLKQRMMERVIDEELPILDMEFKGLDSELDSRDINAVERHIKGIAKNGL